jgi:uncharacterized SAM-binding protein YcdF (DUF218 family)
MKVIDRKHSNKKIARLIGFVLFPILVIALLDIMGAVLIVADPLKRADDIVILSGGGESRLHEAISLYEEKYADAIILTETGAILKGYSAEYSSDQRLLLVNAGIPSSAITITPKHSASTRDEAKDVRTLVENSGAHDLIVVTDPYHTLRARMIWNEVFQKSQINIIVRPVRNSWYKSTTWWLSTAGWENTLNEYIKLASYVILHKTD